MKSFPLSLIFCIAPCVQAVGVDLYQAQQYSTVVTQQKPPPFGGHVLSRMGRMLTWANYAKLSEKEFVDTVLYELHEARTYRKKQKSNHLDNQ